MQELRMHENLVRGDAFLLLFIITESVIDYILL